MTIQYKQFFATKGTTNVNQFWGDIHVLNFRADKVINSFTDLKDQVERFTEDATQFDVVDYAGKAKFNKSKRKYSVPVQRRVLFEVIVFEYQGKEYRLKTTKLSNKNKSKKFADKVIEEYLLEVTCLVDDATEKILGELDEGTKLEIVIP